MRTSRKVSAAAAALIAGCAAAMAQTASPDTPPPRFSSASAFDPKAHPLSAKQQGGMVRIAGGTYRIGSPARHALADPLAMPEHKVAVKPFRIDRTEVTNAQFAEFLNALPMKPSGTALGGKVSVANIPREYHAVLLEFSSRPSPYTMIDLDDSEALIGVREGRFAPNPGFESHPVTERRGRARSPTVDGAVRGFRPRWNGRPPRAGCRAAPSRGVRPCPPPSWR